VAVMTGGQALARALIQEGVTTIFGLPGIQLDWAFDALYEARETIRVIHTRHEQATSYMADGFARTTGRVGVCLVVPGPGLLNAAAGLATAYACSSRVLCLTGQISSDLIGLGRGVLHEIPEQLRLAGSFTRWAARATSPNEIPRLVHEAMRQLHTGRPRPVLIEIPPDVLQATASVDLGAPAATTPAPVDPEVIDRAARLLGTATSPLILAGGGVLAAGAWEELRLLAELLEAPVVMTSSGRGALSDRHYLAQSPHAWPRLARTADALLAVGTRFTISTDPLPPDTRTHAIIRLDIDPAEFRRAVTPAVAIAGDARVGLTQLIQRIPRYNRSRASRREELLSLKGAVAADLERVQPQAALAMAIRAELPDSGILVNESTQVGYWANLGFPVYAPRTFLTSGYQGTLGYGFPTALGARAGNPDRPVVSINGDGGFLYNVQELSTMVRHGLAVVAVVFDDGAYGNVRRIQQQEFGGRLIASDLQNPDFVRLAEAFGIRGVRAEGPEGLRRALREALRAGEPALIAVPVGEMPRLRDVLAGRQTAPTAGPPRA